MPHQQLRFPLSDPAAIAANAQGVLTPDQRSALNSAALPGLLIGLVGLLVMLVALPVGWLVFSAPGFSHLIAYSDQSPDTLRLGTLTLTFSYGRVVLGVLLFSWALLTLACLVSLAHSLRSFTAPHRSRIGWADGMLVWDGAYVARIPGLPDLRRTWHSGLIENLPPGRYRFYFLSSKRWLLSAQWLGPADSAQAATMAAPDTISGPATMRPGTGSLLEAIARANGFSLPALPANRAGHLTPDQVSWALRRNRREKIGSAALGLFTLAVTISAATSGLGKDGIAKGQTSAIIFSIIFGLITLYAFWYAFVARGSYREDAEEGRVASLEGNADKYVRVEHSRRGRGGTTYHYYYYYTLEGMKFQVSQQAYQALVVGLPYRFYYLPRSRALVNIEPL